MAPPWLHFAKQEKTVASAKRTPPTKYSTWKFKCIPVHTDGRVKKSSYTQWAKNEKLPPFINFTKWEEERVVFLSNVQLDCFSACVCSFPFPTSSALMIRLVEIPVWEFLVESPHNSKVYAVLKYSKHLSHSSSLPILPFLNSKLLFPLQAFSFPNSLSLWR